MPLAVALTPLGYQLSKSEDWKQLKASLDGMSQAQLKRYFYPDKGQDQKSSETPATTCSLRIFFISAANSGNGLHAHVDPAIMQLLYEKAGLTARFLVDFYEAHDWTVFPTSSVANPGSSAHGICSRLFKSRDTHTDSPPALQYGFWIWRPNSTHSFTQLVTDSVTSTYFFVNFPDSLQNHIMATVKSRPSVTCNPLFIDTLIIDDVIASYRAAIAELRLSLLNIEKDVDKSTIEDRTRKLHALAVKWHTILKDMKDIQEHIQHLQSFSVRIPCQSHSSMSDDQMHNLAAQRVSSETADIALQAQREGVSMFTLAMVTAVFLPGTFVCSVLSTVFFSFDGTAFVISGWWWTLPTVALPLTGLVMYLWFIWFRTRLSYDRVALETRGQKKGLSG
ncbi:hypothetical protein FBEOM_8907 [Fusarium beomiforme]|uniref:Uncharacterized protein n=1 Tax=Fusarium beomiforme TaxID=44412 RepID=A0A9P5DWD5_9HYPO|nr:hypothetical protein FBEOM_8907 [Fusarium beomiforme]